MGFLSALFDPVGALATGSTDNSTFNSVFNPGENLFGNDGLGWEPTGWSNFQGDVGNTADNFAGNTLDANLDELRNLGNHFKSNPGQLFYAGADPLSTSVWNKVTNQNNTPFLNQYGGETNKDFGNSQARGVNTEDHQYLSTLANMIAGYYGGKALGGLGANTAAGSGISGTTEGSAGSSAFSDMTGATSGGGFGSSQTALDAAALRGYASTGAGAYTGYDNLAGGVTRGTAGGAANALDSNQNVFAGAARGGLQAGIGSNLDYASGLGVDDPLYKAGINGAINGGARTAMSGDTSNSGYGALVGALGGLAGQAGQYFNKPTSGDAGASGTTNWGNLATGLGNLWMARQNDKGIQGQINSLNGLYQPGGAYAKQMQQSLDRQDAAGGRRSQYGTRAVELQAQLANAASHNAPTLANLYQQQRQNRFNQYAGLLGTARNSGAFNNLGGMFGNQGGQDPMSYVNEPAQMPQYNAGPAVMSTMPPMIDPDQIYGGNG